VRFAFLGYHAVRSLLTIKSVSTQRRFPPITCQKYADSSVGFERHSR